MQLAPRTEQLAPAAPPAQHGSVRPPQLLHEPALHAVPAAEQVPTPASPKPGQQASFNRPQVIPMHMPFSHMLSGPGQPSAPGALEPQQGWPGWPHLAHLSWTQPRPASQPSKPGQQASPSAPHWLHVPLRQESEVAHSPTLGAPPPGTPPPPALLQHICSFAPQATRQDPPAVAVPPTHTPALHWRAAQQR